MFKSEFVQASGKLRRQDLRLVVDTREDLILIRQIYKQLYSDGNIFYTDRVLDLIDTYPEMISINAHVIQKEVGEP